MKGSDVESITRLLKTHGVPLSAVRANRLLMELGLLEEATRESATRPGVIKTYKVVTEAGLDFGVNEENPQSPGQSSPYWYKDSFAELAARLVAADTGTGTDTGTDTDTRAGTRADATASGSGASSPEPGDAPRGGPPKRS